MNIQETSLRKILPQQFYALDFKVTPDSLRPSEFKPHISVIGGVAKLLTQGSMSIETAGLKLEWKWQALKGQNGYSVEEHNEDWKIKLIGAVIIDESGEEFDDFAEGLACIRVVSAMEWQERVILELEKADSANQSLTAA